MNTNLPKDATQETASIWLRQLVRDFGIGFHLDTRSRDYVGPDGASLFTESQCDVLESSINRLFEILGDDLPYDICADEALIMMAENRGMKPPIEYHDPDFQRRVLRNGTREDLINWLSWNDPNGIWTDHDSIVEDKSPLTLDDARQWMSKAISELD